MLQRHIRQLLAVAFAISVFTAMSVAPVAASESVDIGGDSGISIGTDGIGIGGDDGIQIGADPEDGVNASVGGDEGVTVGASPDDGAEVGVGGDEGATVGANPDDGVDAEVGGEDVVPETGDLDSGEVGDIGTTDGGLDAVGSQVDGLSGGATGVDSFDGGLDDPTSGLDSVDTGELSEVTDGLGGTDVPTEPTDLDLDSDEVPNEAQLLRQVLQNVPETDVVGPEDSPIGDERAAVNVCDPLDPQTPDELPVPVGLLPSLSDAPVEPPGVPSDLITPEAVTGILLGFYPGACEVFNPSDPQIDPTNLPDEPAGEIDVARGGQYDGGGVGLVYYDGTLNESGDGPSVSGLSGILVTPEYGDLDQELVLNDGKNDYGVDPQLSWGDDGYEYRAVLILLGKQAGIEGTCENLQEYEGDTSFESLEENPLGPCEYQLVGLPNLYGPGDVFGTINDQANRDEPPVDLDALPVNPDALLDL